MTGEHPSAPYFAERMIAGFEDAFDRPGQLAVADPMTVPLIVIWDVACKFRNPNERVDDPAVTLPLIVTAPDPAAELSKPMPALAPVPAMTLPLIVTVPDPASSAPRLVDNVPPITSPFMIRGAPTVDAPIAEPAVPPIQFPLMVNMPVEVVLDAPAILVPDVPIQFPVIFIAPVLLCCAPEAV